MNSRWATLLGVVLGLSFLASGALAAISPEEAERLGKDLTPVGAERAGNEAGTIPEWTGGLTEPPPYFEPYEGYVNPFADEKPLFVITADNIEQYKDHLTPGQIAMFRKYPDTYKMPVYPTHRSAAHSQEVYKAIKHYATTAELTNEGNGLKGIGSSPVPFPIPNNGLEAIWNHLVHYFGGGLKRHYTAIPVQADGDFYVVRFEDAVAAGFEVPGTEENRLLFFKQTALAPSRQAGNVLLAQEPINQIKEPRIIWSYNVGQRRVRQMPSLAYDGPGLVDPGMSTMDNFSLYNGSPDRYEWELLGKQEVYIPYNAYGLMSTDLKYKDILKQGHLNPEHTRYELHRVWVVQATLKDGQRHIYAKRVFFFDEDTWMISMVDHYDGLGELWRVAEGHLMNHYEVPTSWYASDVLYDLKTSRYLVTWLINEDYQPPVYGYKMERAFFTPEALLRSGKTLRTLSPERAARLGKDLTPIGAERAGNLSGYIPEWTGGLSKPPANYNPTKGFVNPFPKEKPRFVITAANMAQYQDNLTPGQMAMLRKYPNTYRMPVYPTRRTAAFPALVYNAVKKYATTAQLVQEGNGISNIGNSPVPFPIPRNGLEVIWNHNLRYRGGSVKRYYTEIPVWSDGRFNVARFDDVFTSASALPGVEGNRLFFARRTTVAPSARVGNSALIIEPLNQVREPRSAWIYNAGQRRVRRAPYLAYDGPLPGEAANMGTVDNYGMFIGSPDRYDWSLVGKKEVFIPYNAYDLASTALKYKDILNKGHLNQDLTRYELHRVWVVEATLKEGMRHIYAKRVFYIDEDTWHAVAVDHYDGRGGLWRVAEAHLIVHYTVPMPWYACEALYDLQAGRYLTRWLNNEDYRPFEYNYKVNRAYFTPEALRRSGGLGQLALQD